MVPWLSREVSRLIPLDPLIVNVPALVSVPVPPIVPPIHCKSPGEK